MANTGIIYDNANNRMKVTKTGLWLPADLVPDTEANIIASTQMLGPGSTAIAKDVGWLYRYDGTTASAWMRTATAHLPEDQGLLGETFDSACATQTTLLPTAGVLVFGRVPLRMPYSQTMGRIAGRISTGGVTLSNCFLGVYTVTAGTATLVSGTADQSGVWTAATNINLALTTPTAITGGRVGATGLDVVVLVALLIGGFATAPMFRGGVADQVNTAGPVTGLKLRFGQTGAGLTALPATFAAGSVSNVAFSPWFGISP